MERVGGGDAAQRDLFGAAGGRRREAARQAWRGVISIQVRPELVVTYMSGAGPEVMLELEI